MRYKSLNILTHRELFLVLVLFSILATTCFAIDITIIDYKKGENPGDLWGDKVEGIGDVNGDGYGDFLVTEYLAHRLHLYYGGPNAFDDPPVLTWENQGSEDGSSSYSPINVGDVDCDGVDDFINLFNDDDTLKLLTGLDALDPEAHLVMWTQTDLSYSLFYACGNGDNNNDGIPDFWVYPYRGSKDTVIQGYSGCDELDNIPDFQIYRPPDPGNNYGTIGYEICNTCDLNGDSIPDVFWGEHSQYYDSSGRACIVWGDESLSTHPDLVFYAPYEHDGNLSFGADMACLGDVSGDGIDDIWIGQGGRNYIYFGGNPFDTIPDIALDWSYVGGNYIDCPGDINDDGYNDVMLTMDSYLFSYVSFIYCYPGMDTLMDVAWSDGDYYSAFSDGIICCLGEDHSPVGDVNGDGIDDILLAPRSTNYDAQDYGWVVLQAGWHDPQLGVEDNDLPIPNSFDIEQNYPNPFNSETVIKFTLPRSGFTELTIYNLLGEKVVDLVNRDLQAGEHRIVWDGSDNHGNPVATGVYFYRVTSGDYSQTKKMVLLK